MNRMGWVPLLWVGLGGFCGAILRFLISHLVHRGLSNTVTFPLGTVVVNVLGCLLLGILGGIAEHQRWLGPTARLFLMVGLLGSFTTFSTFAFETLVLTQKAEFAKALLNVSIQVVIGFLAAWLGYAWARPG